MENEKISRRELFPYCKVLYKKEDSPGWYVAYIDGTIEQATKKCEKIWSIYKVFEGGKSVERTKDEYPVNVRADDAHLLSGWTYSAYLDKWFLFGEIVPKPKSKCRIARKFKIENNFEADIDDIEDKKESLFEDSFYDTNETDIVSDVTFATNQACYTFDFQYIKSQYKETFDDLFKALDENHYYCFFVEEYWYTQILIWSDENNCRIIVQDYTSSEQRGVVDQLDFIIDKKTAIDTFKNWRKELDARWEYIDKQVMSLLTNEEKTALRK